MLCLVLFHPSSSFKFKMPFCVSEKKSSFKGNQQKMEKKQTPMPTPPMPMPPSQLERKPSIDSEPKTLLEDEMTLAREAALKILHTHTKEEALKLFTTGLVPVKSLKKEGEDAVDATSDCED